MNTILHYLNKSQLPEIVNDGESNKSTFGNYISTGSEDGNQTEIVLMGIPQDEGVRRNGGRTGARKAPAAIRSHLYQLPVSEKIAGIKMADLGDLRFNGKLEDAHRLQEKVVYELLQNQKKVVILGGGNDISYPDLRALWKYNPSLTAINIDSHYDVRPDTPRNSGTPYRQALDEGIIKATNFYEVGQKPMINSLQHEHFLKENRVNMYPLQSIRSEGLISILDTISKKTNEDQIFWGLDMDVVKSSEAPGVSAPYPIGLSAGDLCQIAYWAGMDPRTQIIEISEVNPDFDDQNGSTCRLVALLVMYYLAGFRERFFADRTDFAH